MRFSLPRAAFAVAAVLLLYRLAAIKACIHPERGYRSIVTEKTKQAFVFHDGKNAHLIIQTQLQSEKNLPSALAWVVPLPSLPVRYEEADPKLFDELLALTMPASSRSAGNSVSAGNAEDGPGATTESIKVHDVQVAGSYKIQPIEILSDASGEELNTWLTSNGFGAVPPENQRHYLRKGAVFLTLKLSRLQGETTVVKPLHIVYPSDRLSLPLKFSSHSGVFDVLLYTFTTKQADETALEDFHLELVASVAVKPHAKGITVIGAQRSGLETRQIKNGRASSGNQSSSLFQLLARRPGYLTRFYGEGFNGASNRVQDLPIDPFLMPDGSALPQSSANLTGLVGAALAVGALLMFAGRRRSLRARHVL